MSEETIIVEEKKIFNKIISIGLSILFIIAFLSVLVLLVKIDVGGLGSQVLRPVLKDIPVLKSILPPNNGEVEIVDENYPYTTVPAAIEAIKSQEDVSKEQLAQIEALNNELMELQKENTRLKVFEENQIQFQEDKKLFDEQVVFNNNAISTEEYINFYSMISPQNAEELYQSVLEEKKYSDEVKNFAITYKKMKPANAARILEQLMSDIDLVVDILENVDSDQRASILAAMDPAVAARITKKMAP